jgi:hypothetical protein
MFLPEPLNELANETWVSLAFMAVMFILIIPIMFVGIIAQLTTIYGANSAKRKRRGETYLSRIVQDLAFRISGDMCWGCMPFSAARGW